MSLTNNKIKSTTIYGALNVLDMTDNSVLSSAYIKRNLTVDGNINSVPNSKFAFLTNITSDIQTQINNKSSSTDLTTTNTNITTLQNKTTDISYNSSTLTTTYGNNLIVSGNINSVPNSKFAYLTNITSDLQTQINSKSNKAGDNTFTGINTTGGLTINGLLSNGNKGILQLNDFNSLSSGFYTYIHNSSGINSYRSLGPGTTATSHYFTTQNSAGVESYTMTLQNNLINLNQPTVISGSLNVNNIVLNPAGTITFPSSLPTTTSTNAGLGITWNDPASGVGSGTGRSNFINYAQGGIGGFTFTTEYLTTAPITNN